MYIGAHYRQKGKTSLCLQLAEYNKGILSSFLNGKAADSSALGLILNSMLTIYPSIHQWRVVGVVPTGKEVLECTSFILFK